MLPPFLVGIRAAAAVHLAASLQIWNWLGGFLEGVVDNKSPKEFLRSDTRWVFNFDSKFKTLLMKLDMLWLLFDEIDLTIGFGRIEIGWVSFLQVWKTSGWPPHFVCQNIDYVQNWPVLSDLRFVNWHPRLTRFIALIAAVVFVCANYTPRAASIYVLTSPSESTESPDKPSLWLSSEDCHRTRFDETNPAVTFISRDSAPVEKSTVWSLLHVFRGRGSVIRSRPFMW